MKAMQQDCRKCRDSGDYYVSYYDCARNDGNETASWDYEDTG